jgi:hypothetical protein
MGRQQMISSTDELASLSLARAYIDAVRERLGSLGARELIDTLDRVDRAYREFPELALERPHSSLASLVMLLLDQIIRADGASTRHSCHPRESGGRAMTAAASSALDYCFRGNDEETPVSLLGRFREFRWDAIEPVVGVLRQQGRTDTILEIISAVLDRVTFIDEESTAGFGELLKNLLGNEHPLEIESGALVGLLRSARYRLKPRAPGRHRPGAKEALLTLAERMRAAPPPRAPPKPHPDRAWPSGRLSFDEFLLQWPCEIDLSAELDDAAFIDEVYRAILLRGPAIVERNQYLKLLRDGAVSREWIIEDLLASQELHSLERRLRVAYNGQMITEPGSSGQDDMPVVTWPAPS